MSIFGFGNENNKGSSFKQGSTGASNGNDTESTEYKKGIAAYLDAFEKDKEEIEETGSSSLQKALKKKLAETGVSFEFELLQIAKKKQQMFINRHQIITDVGLFIKNAPGEQSLYTEQFTYDPFRTSFGSIWKYALYSGQLAYGSPAIGVAKLKKLMTISTPEGIAGLVGSHGMAFSRSLIPLVKFRFAPFLKNNGITHVKFSPPALMPTDSDFASKVLGQSMSQYMFVYFDFDKYNKDFYKNLVPFNIFFNVKQKLEGYTFANNNFVGGVAALDFRGPEGSLLNYNACFVDPERNLNNLIDQGIFNSKEIEDLQNPQFGQSTLVSDIENTIFSDHAIHAPHAISEEALPFFGSETIQGNLIADAKPTYNYFLPEWEVATSGLPELFIGNVYSAAQQSAFGQLSSEYNFKKFALKWINCSLNEEEYGKQGKVKGSSNIVINPDRNFLDVVEDMKTQFPMYNEVSFSSIPPGDLSLSMKESGLTNEFIKTMLTYLYGNYASQNSNEDLFSTLAKLMTIGQVQPPIITGNKSYVVSKVKDPASLDLFDKSEETVFSDDGLYYFDFINWLQWYLNELDDPPGQDEFKLYDGSIFEKYSSFYGGLEHQMKFLAGSNKNSFEKFISMTKFLSRFADQVAVRSRGLHELFSGDSSNYAQKDVLYYRIQKKSDKTKAIVQNFFVLPEELDPSRGYASQLKIVDTQVKYGESYTYEIFATYIIVGTEYQYTVAPSNNQDVDFQSIVSQNLNVSGESMDDSFTRTIYTEEDSTKKITLYPGKKNSQPLLAPKWVMPIKADMRPSIKIVEAPLYKEEAVIITDNPPMPPLVNMYPLSGQRNKILMTLETQTGDRELVPVTVETEDTAQFVVQRFTQKREIVYPGGEYVYKTLRFKSDDASSAYQIYRLDGEENRPSFYTDFKGKLYQSLDQLQTIPQAGFEDNINVNTKYYYMFRSIDMHGNKSNPSPVYEVEMVDAGQDVFYPVINAYDIEELKKMNIKSDRKTVSTESRSLKKTVQIRAADQQILLNEEASGITGETANIPNQDIVLGVAKHSLWNDKVFKFRFTSKHTGRKIDINVDFNTTFDKPVAPIQSCFAPEEE